MALCAEVRASSNLNMELIMSQATDTHAPSAPRLIYDNTDLALPSPRDDEELFQLCSQFNILERINRVLGAGRPQLLVRFAGKAGRIGAQN
jgi:hypothetical protein